MTTQVPYEVPVVFQELSKIESYLQLFDALDHMSAVVNDFFGNIATKVCYRLHTMQELIYEDTSTKDQIGSH